MQNYSVTPVLWAHKPNRHGLCPVVIRITIDRKSTYIKTIFKVLEAQWDKKSAKVLPDYDNHQVINFGINKMVSDTESELLLKSVTGLEVDGAELKRELKNFDNKEDFYAFCSAWLDAIENEGLFVIYILKFIWIFFILHELCSLRNTNMENIYSTSK